MANSIVFNGEIKSDFIDVGGGFVAFNIEDFPIIIIKTKIEELSSALKKGDKIAGAGFLAKNGDDWMVCASSIELIK